MVKCHFSAETQESLGCSSRKVELKTFIRFHDKFKNYVFTETEKLFNGKLHSLCSVIFLVYYAIG